MDGGAVLKRGRRPRRPPSPAPAAAQPVLAPHAPPDVMALPHPDWLYQELTVTGDGDALWSFRQAAAGAGHVPWAYDYDRLEEHWLSLMLAQPGRTISLQGAKIVARETKEAFRDEHEEACAWVGRSQAVPLDLHSLVPVPWEVLRLGPDAPASLRWLWRHWGTDVAAAAGRAPPRPRRRMARGLLVRRLDTLARRRGVSCALATPHLAAAGRLRSRLNVFFTF